MKTEKNKTKIVPLLLFLILGSFFVLFITKSYNKIAENTGKKVCIENKKCFYVEVADTPKKRISGLSNRDILGKDNGMLFIFVDEEIPGFWMKDMRFSIDIIWINKDKKIVGIEDSLEPCKENLCSIFYPKEKIKYVLEINSGLSKSFGFSKGDSVYIK